MPLTAEQIEIARSHGMQNVELIAQCCNETGGRFFIALAMLEKETGTCRNVYGTRCRGALSGFPKPVTKDNYEVFEWLVFTKGQRSNGVGPSQLTFKGFLPIWSRRVSSRTTCATHRVWRQADSAVLPRRAQSG
jgi:hypothetical protein